MRSWLASLSSWSARLCSYCCNASASSARSRTNKGFSVDVVVVIGEVVGLFERVVVVVVVAHDQSKRRLRCLLAEAPPALIRGAGMSPTTEPKLLPPLRLLPFISQAPLFIVYATPSSPFAHAKHADSSPALSSKHSHLSPLQPTPHTHSSPDADATPCFVHVGISQAGNEEPNISGTHVSHNSSPLDPEEAMLRLHSAQLVSALKPSLHRQLPSPWASPFPKHVMPSACSQCVPE